MTARYFLNFKCFKVCVEEVLDYFIERVVPFNYYLKKVNCEPYFYRCKISGVVEFSLDNPYEKKILAKTDYKLLYLLEKNFKNE